MAGDFRVAVCKGHFSALRSEGRKLKIRPGEGPFYGHDHKFLVILVGEDRLKAGIAHQIDILRLISFKPKEPGG